MKINISKLFGPVPWINTITVVGQGKYKIIPYNLVVPGRKEFFLNDGDMSKGHRSQLERDSNG